MSHAPDPGDTWDCIAATLWPPEHFLMRGTSLHCIAACRAVGWQVEETASGSTWIIVEPRSATPSSSAGSVPRLFIGFVAGAAASAWLAVRWHRWRLATDAGAAPRRPRHPTPTAEHNRRDALRWKLRALRRGWKPYQTREDR